MKKEYDFSKGERGKFYQLEVELHMPIYLDQEVLETLQKLANKRNVEISTLVNEWIKKDISIVQF